MNNIIFRSKKGNQYIFSETEKMIMYIPPNLNKMYYKKKRIFLETLGVFDNFSPNLVTKYTPNQLKINLANLRLIMIEVTDGCNLSCEYCGYGKLYNNYDNRKGIFQKIEIVKLFIDHLVDLWESDLNLSYNDEIIISFYGGEPLIAFSLIKDIVTYVDSLRVKKHHFSYNITTNAYYLDKCIDFLVEKDFNILISLDGNKENNSYRLTKEGNNSFDKIFRNIKSLQEKYPDYFNNKVQFNSVLHDKNSIKDIRKFIKNEFNKQPIISELNTNGIAIEYKKRFLEMFKTIASENKKAINEKPLDKYTLFTRLDIKKLSSFIDAFISNTYKRYKDLFIDKKHEKYIPTGTCSPFKRRLLLTVNNKILSCERIGYNYTLGKVENGKINIDYDYVVDIYSKLYQEIIEQCKECILWKNCSLCIYFIEKENGLRKCTSFLSKEESNEYFCTFISLLEEYPFLYKEVVDKMNQY